MRKSLLTLKDPSLSRCEHWFKDTFYVVWSPNQKWKRLCKWTRGFTLCVRTRSRRRQWRHCVIIRAGYFGRFTRGRSTAVPCVQRFLNFRTAITNRSWLWVVHTGRTDSYDASEDSAPYNENIGNLKNEGRNRIDAEFIKTVEDMQMKAVLWSIALLISEIYSRIDNMKSVASVKECRIE